MQLPTPDEPTDRELKNHSEASTPDDNLEEAIGIYFWNQWGDEIEAELTQDDFISIAHRKSVNVPLENWSGNKGGWNHVVRQYADAIRSEL